MFRPLLLAGLAAGAALSVALPASAQFSCQYSGSNQPAHFIEFPTGSAKARIDAKMKAELDAFAKDVKESYATHVCIVGRASKLGDSGKNMRLAEERAHVVAAELRNRGVKSDIISAQAAGEAYQGLFGSSKNNSQDDRRVEYWFNR